MFFLQTYRENSSLLFKSSLKVIYFLKVIYWKVVYFLRKIQTLRVRNSKILRIKNAIFSGY